VPGAYVFGGLLGLVAGIWVADVGGTPPLVVGALGGGLLGAVLGATETPYTGPPWKPHRDPRPKTEDEWREFEAACTHANADPSKVWCYRDLGVAPVEKGLLLSLPLHDWVAANPSAG
jgi:hypothetical protein